MKTISIVTVFALYKPVQKIGQEICLFLLREPGKIYYLYDSYGKINYKNIACVLS
jgi:hypothetical protein